MLLQVHPATEISEPAVETGGKSPQRLGGLVWFRAVLTNTLVGWPHLRMFQFQAGYVYDIKNFLHHVSMSNARIHVRLPTMP